MERQGIDLREAITEQVVVKLRPSEKRYLRECAVNGDTYVSDILRLGVGLDPAPRGRAAWRQPAPAAPPPAPKPPRRAPTRQAGPARTPRSTRSTSAEPSISETSVRPEALSE